MLKRNAETDPFTLGIGDEERRGEKEKCKKKATAVAIFYLLYPAIFCLKRTRLSILEP